jgi:hypothetical protein
MSDDEGINKLTVRVVEAKDLAGKDFNGLSDPYCIVTLEKNQVRREKKGEGSGRKILMNR